jgi:hypothetical protein
VGRPEPPARSAPAANPAEAEDRRIHLPWPRPAAPAPFVVTTGRLFPHEPPAEGGTHHVGVRWPAPVAPPDAAIAPAEPLFGDVPGIEAGGRGTKMEWRRARHREGLASVARVTLAAAAVSAALSAVGMLTVLRAATAARDGQHALVEAERALTSRDTAAARAAMLDARSAFRRGSVAVQLAGPLLVPTRLIPVVRIQLRATERFLAAGESLANAGLGVTDAVDAVVHPRTHEGPLTAVLPQLMPAERALTSSVGRLDHAVRELSALDGYRLIGPLASARRELATRLPEIQGRLTRAAAGVRALSWFVGSDQPRSYLVVTQNPDELRPTGGFIGTLGVLRSEGGRLSVERFGAVEAWYTAHPEAALPPDAAAEPLRFPTPGRQTIANVNATADWPAAAELAMRLWEQGGEAPVDGVLSVTPGFLARLLTVLGPVEVPEYHESVTAENLVERTDYYTHRAQAVTGQRKDFLVQLAPIVLDRLVRAPASSWEALGVAIGRGFQRRDAMAWGRDPSAADALVLNGWAGSLPLVGGDFFHEGDFEYAAKNGRAIRRIYDHDVQLRADGSAAVSTKIHIANTGRPAPGVNNDTLSHITVSGPTGATFDEGRSDEPIGTQPPINAHPGESWMRAAGPGETTELRVAWNAPGLLERRGRTLRYRLTWLGVADHAGDTLNLRVAPPKGWHWQGERPPATVPLDGDFVGTWVLARD